MKKDPSNHSINNANQKLHSMGQDRSWFETDLVERFTRYVKVHTTSDPLNSNTPSTEQQWDLAKILYQELKALGVDDVTLTDHCYVVARIDGTINGPTIGFLSHMDTSPDFSGENVKPQIHKDYQGGRIRLNEELFLDPINNPELERYKGETIITTDGTTLLGADDKAGIAEIMTGIRYLLEHPEIPRGPIDIIFTPDEEIGRGVEKLPYELLRAKYCYTFDGDVEGTYNSRCFNAYSFDIEFKGQMIHPGDARGRLVNALSMASMFVGLLPRNESPEATDGDYGYYCANRIEGTMEHTKLSMFIRDFKMSEINRRIEYINTIAKTVEGSFPGGEVKLSTKKQYFNIEETVQDHPQVLEFLEDAIRDTGIEPVQESIRGGTDGARLSERGYPTPNIFAGGLNFHSRNEWIALPAMVRASKVMINLVQRWADQ